ncbi:MAG: MoxR family ATPase [Deltaproteobacteria bacterium]|nr:MoxR family ATPase [Deltaproteobacteria bacterium]
MENKTGTDTRAIDAQAEQFRRTFLRVAEETAKVIVGQRDIIEGVLTCLVAQGHALLEGVPGLGKTRLVKTLGDTMHLTFSRIQFTPDLMPADIVGTNIIAERGGERRFEFQRGPVFANLVLADEINRATPKTQSALLEAMQERSVTVAKTTTKLDPPFFVLATQNPLEMEGTYPLPEAQLDRFFFKLKVGFPSRDELHAILDRTTQSDEPTVAATVSRDEVLAMRDTLLAVPVARYVQDYAIRLVLATHPSKDAPDSTRKFVRYGASPRGGQALMLAGKVNALLGGRYSVGIDDVRAAAKAALRHRIILNFEGEAEGVDTDAIIEKLILEVPER